MSHTTHEQELLERIEQLEARLADLSRKREKPSLDRQRWQALMDESPFGVAIYAPDGAIKAANEGMRRIFMLSEEEAGYAKTVYNILEDPQVQEKGLAEPLRQAFAGRPAQLPPVKYELETPIEGETVTRWIEAAFFPILNEEGSVREVVSIQIDVSQLAQTQENLEHSERVMRDQLRELDHLYDVEPVGLCLLDSQLRFVRINERMAEINGPTVEEHLGKTVREILPDIADRIEPLYRRVLESGEPLLNLEVHGVTPADPATPRDWIISYYPIAGEHGNVEAVTSVVQEITHIKRAEAALAKSERRFRQIAENIREVFWLLETPSLEFVYISPSWEQLTGHPASEVNSESNGLLAIIHPEDRGIVMGANETLLAQGGSTTFEHRLRHRDGSFRWVSVRATAVPDESGAVTRLTGITEDITEQKLAATERQRFEAKVRQAQKLESLGVLAGGIAHDFNNLLMGVLGNADLASLALTPESPAFEYVGRIRTAAQRASELANQMLAYSGKGRLAVGAIDLNRLVTEMKHLLETAISKKVRLNLDLGRDLPAIEADANQIRQIVMNLITNASEAIGDDSGVVRVSTSIVDADDDFLGRCELGVGLPPGLYVRLDVADTGAGIPQNVRAKMFDPFFTTKFTGRGLGLAAALGIVQSHGAAMCVESSPDEGSTFSILFPPSSALAVPEVSDTTAASSSIGGTILVVDDENIVREVAQAMLENAGYSVIPAADGNEAVAAFGERGDDIDLVLLDMAMPGLDGRETFEKIREMRPNVPVVFSSGYSEEETAMKLNARRGIDFVHKPYKIQDLLDSVRSVLESLDS